jgi:hypothetical protein
MREKRQRNRIDQNNEQQALLGAKVAVGRRMSNHCPGVGSAGMLNLTKNI